MNYIYIFVKLILFFVFFFKGIFKVFIFIVLFFIFYGIDLLCVMFEFYFECKIRIGLLCLKIVLFFCYRFCFIE